MRCGFIWQALTVALLATSSTDARAGNWCAYAARPKALIECGYSSVAECENAIGKGGMCFLNPEFALKARRAPPVLASKAPLLEQVT